MRGADVRATRSEARWDNIGRTIFHFTSSLIIGSFTAAKLFEPREILANWQMCTVEACYSRIPVHLANFGLRFRVYLRASIECSWYIVAALERGKRSSTNAPTQCQSSEASLMCVCVPETWLHSPRLRR